MQNVTNATALALKSSRSGRAPSLNGRFPSPPLAASHPRTEFATGNGIVFSLFVKAFLGLLAFDVFGFGRDFAKMHRFVGSWKLSVKEVSDGTVTDVCTAINYACAWYPKRALCLQRSAVTTCLLRSCGVPATMVLGAQPLPFKAHAWTEIRGTSVNERRDVQKHYAVWERC